MSTDIKKGGKFTRILKIMAKALCWVIFAVCFGLLFTQQADGGPAFGVTFSAIIGCVLSARALDGLGSFD